MSVFLTCVSLSCDRLRQLAGPSPSAAPEPADGIQTPGTDDPLSLAAAYVVLPTTSPPHWASEQSSRPGAPSPQCWAPCRDCGLRLNQGRDDVIEPLKSVVLVGLVLELEGQALWFYLQREKGQHNGLGIRSATD